MMKGIAISLTAALFLLSWVLTASNAFYVSDTISQDDRDMMRRLANTWSIKEETVLVHGHGTNWTQLNATQCPMVKCRPRGRTDIALLWRQTEGPHTLDMRHTNSAVMLFRPPAPGLYCFQLTVIDRDSGHAIEAADYYSCQECVDDIMDEEFDYLDDIDEEDTTTG